MINDIIKFLHREIFDTVNIAMEDWPRPHTPTLAVTYKGIINKGDPGH